MKGQKFSLKGMISEYGFMSVYDGLSAGILRQVFYASSRVGLFDIVRDRLHQIRGKTDFASRYVWIILCEKLCNGDLFLWMGAIHFIGTVVCYVSSILSGSDSDFEVLQPYYLLYATFL